MQLDTLEASVLELLDHIYKASFKGYIVNIIAKILFRNIKLMMSTTVAIF